MGILFNKLAQIGSSERLTRISSETSVFVGRNRVLCGRRFNGRLATYYVDADDKLISPRFIMGDTYEPGATSFFLRNIKRDSHCIDAGTNFGYFSVLMGMLCPRGKVVGIEADSRVADLASENIIVNGLKDSCQIMNRAISNNDDPVLLFRRMSRSGNTSIAKCGIEFTTSMGEEPEEEFRVQGVKLDDLLPLFDGRVDFMKIDIEGAEPLAIEGAHEIIAKNHDIKIVVEWSLGQIQAAGFNIEQYLNTIQSHGLKSFKLSGSRKPTPIGICELANTPYIADLLLCRHLC